MTVFTLSIDGDEFSVHGDLDATTAPALLAAVRYACLDRSVRVRLGGVEFIDLAGLDVLRAIETEMPGGELCEPSEAILRLLALCDRERLVALTPTASVREPLPDRSGARDVRDGWTSRTLGHLQVVPSDDAP